MHSRPRSKVTPDPAFYLREYFHLCLLKYLSQRLSAKGYALKGGACLRFFHRSPRLCEDIAFDVFAEVGVDELKAAVDGVLKSKLFLASLAAQQIPRIIANRTKQTVMTQRWKVLLHLSDSSTLQTKLEFNRKTKSVGYESGAPSAALTNHHRMTPFCAQFYGLAPAAALTIQALAAGDDTAVQDLFDLHHLFFTLGVKPADAARLTTTQELEAAAQALEGLSCKRFKGQVLDHLTGDLQLTYADPAAFERYKSDIEETLIQQI